MNPYLLTITFLMLMGILTSSKVARFADSSLNARMHTLYSGNAAKTEELHVHALLEDFRKSNNRDKNNPPTELDEKNDTTIKLKKASTIIHSAPLRVNLARPPNNSRLNMWQVITDYQLNGAPPKFSLEEVAARLMRALYGQCEFFKAVPNAEYLILKKLVEKKNDTIHFQFPDDLCSLSMDDDDLQHIFYCMMTGTAEAPSLLEYITFDPPQDKQGQARKVNLMFASPLLLQAIIQNEAVVESLLNVRENYWREIIMQEASRKEGAKDQGKNRNTYKKAIKNDFERVFSEHGLKPAPYLKVFDISLGKYGTIILVEDPDTHKIVRKKFIPKIRSVKKDQ